MVSVYVLVSRILNPVPTASVTSPSVLFPIHPVNPAKVTSASVNGSHNGLSLFALLL